MIKAADLKQLFQSLGSAVALVDPESWDVVFENARFFDWFPPGERRVGTLDERLGGLDAEKARGRLAEERPYKFDTEVEDGPRAVSVRLTLRNHEIGGTAYVMVEGINVSKEKEAQYMLESYSRMAEKNARALEKEKNRVERLLLNIMPKSVYEELKDYGVTTPQKFDDASILMLDFVKFTDMTIAEDASALVSELNDIFSAFDRIVETFGCERIRTIGDSYMAVSGVPEAVPDHAANVALAALRMRRYLERRNSAHPQQWRCRMGINTGTIIGSLVGIQKYVYDLFGPGVNLAARMESMSEPMKITVSEKTYELLRDQFAFTERGETEVKGFGSMKLYFLEGEHQRR